MTFLSIFCNLSNDYSSENSHGPFGYGASILGNQEEAPACCCYWESRRIQLKAPALLDAP